MNGDTAPTGREVDAALSALAPVFGPRDAEATAPTDAEVARALGARTRSRGVPWGWLAGGLLLAGGAFAAGRLGAAWTLDAPPEVPPALPAPAITAPPPPPVSPPAEVAPPPPAAPAAPARSAAAPAPVAPIHAAPTPLARDVATAFSELVRRVEAGERTTDLADALDAFAAAHPGPLGDDAAWNGLRIRAAAGDADQALARVVAFRDLHPEREDAAELHADVLRARFGDCAAAWPLYRDLVDAREPQLAARAMGQGGLCALAIGRTDDAAALLAASLAAGVAPPLRDQVARALSSMR